jgi:hypothetical protein
MFTLCLPERYTAVSRYLELALLDARLQTRRLLTSNCSSYFEHSSPKQDLQGRASCPQPIPILDQWLRKSNFHVPASYSRQSSGVSRKKFWDVVRYGRETCRELPEKQQRQSYPRSRSGKPIGLWDFETPTFSRPMVLNLVYAYPPSVRETILDGMWKYLTGYVGLKSKYYFMINTK